MRHPHRSRGTTFKAPLTQFIDDEPGSSVNLRFTVVPEPSSAVLLGLAVLLMGMGRARFWFGGLGHRGCYTVAILVLVVLGVLGGPSAWAERPFSSVSPYGVNGQPDWKFIGLRDLASGAGYKWVRVFMPWHRVQPQQGVWDWTHDDPRINTLHKSGFSILVVLFGTPEWAQGPRTIGCNFEPRQGTNPPKNSDLFRNFVREAVSRYQDKVIAWEVWNEPNQCSLWGGTAKQYKDLLLKPAYDAIKSLRPDHLVIAPGLANSTDFDPWITNESGRLIRNIDALSFHRYGSFEYVEQGMIEANHYQACNGAYCVENYWLTEFGFSTDPRQHDVCPKSNVLKPGLRTVDVMKKCNKQQSCRRTFYFTFHDGGVPGEQGTCDIALIAKGDEPRPKYRTIKNYILGHPVTAGCLPPPPESCEGAGDGTPCGDGDPCNGTELCQGGACVPGTPISCDDGNLCTADSCSPESGCAHAPVPGAPECVASWLPSVMSLLE